MIAKWKKGGGARTEATVGIATLVRQILLLEMRKTRLLDQGQRMKGLNFTPDFWGQSRYKAA